MKRGVFIVIDGLGGSGKSTQIDLLRRCLRGRAVFTHEPGGTKRAERIRALLKSGAPKNPDMLADFFLFWASRAEHMNERIVPALKKGRIVVCDRFDSSTFAMQIRGDGQKGLEKFFWQCRESVLGRFAPDAYIILDIHYRVANERRMARGGGEDRFDERESAYQKRVGAGYREFARHIGKKAHVIDARQPQQEVFGQIRDIIDKITRIQ